MTGWAPERRKRQSELIHGWRPWEKSTGPRTPSGKARRARNAYKGCVRPVLRDWLSYFANRGASSGGDGGNCNSPYLVPRRPGGEAAALPL